MQAKALWNGSWATVQSFFFIHSAEHSEVQLVECNYAVVDKPQDAKAADVFSYYDRLRTYIQHEDSLINSRLTWSLSVHAFLLALYGGIMAQQVQLCSQLQNHLSCLLRNVLSSLFIVQIAIALFGLYVAKRSHKAILAAHLAIQHIHGIASKSEALKMCDQTAVSSGWALLPGLISGGSDERKTANARVYYLGLPKGAFGLWICLLLLSSTLSVVSMLKSDWFLSVPPKERGVCSVRPAPHDTIRRPN